MRRQQRSRRARPLTDTPALALSDDACVRRLAMLLEHKDETSLEDIVALISRLAVPVELT
jgi:hypothetical protein